MTTRSNSTLLSGRSTFAVLASGVIHGALTWAVTGLAASAPPPALEVLAIEMLAPEEPAPPEPPVEPAPPLEEVAPPEPPPEPPPVEPPPEPRAEPPPEPDDAPPDDTPTNEEPSEPEPTEEPAEEPAEADGPPDADAPGLDGLLAGDGATGFEVRRGGRAPGRGRATPKSAPRPVAKPAPPPAPTPVPFRDLSRRPQPPPLDALLERNYPPSARRLGRAGSARVALLIGLDGRVRSARVVSASEPEFGDACARTLRQSRWSPPQDDQGNAVPTIAPYECHFRVER